MPATGCSRRPSAHRRTGGRRCSTCRIAVSDIRRSRALYEAAIRSDWLSLVLAIRPSKTRKAAAAPRSLRHANNPSLDRRNQRWARHARRVRVETGAGRCLLPGGDRGRGRDNGGPTSSALSPILCGLRARPRRFQRRGSVPRRAMSQSRIFTIGYEATTMAEFLAALTEAGVERVIDVRALPLSRRPGFSKTPLRAALAEVGIDYVHLRALGTPAEGRSGRSAATGPLSPGSMPASSSFPRRWSRPRR